MLTRRTLLDLETNADGIPLSLPSTATRASLAPSGVAMDPYPATQPANLLEPGSEFGCYTVVGRVGTSALGERYEAFDATRGCTLLLDVFPEGDSAQVDASNGGATHDDSRFIQSMRALIASPHPNIVPVYDAGLREGVVFVVTERTPAAAPASMVPGVRREDDWRLTLRRFLPAARGLVAAHGLGVVHLSISPDAVVSGPNAQTRIANFGRHRVRPLPPTMTGDPSRGTRPARYVAPEELVGDLTDFASDQWSLAALLYEALYNEPPFDCQDVFSLGSAILEGRVRPAPAGTRVPGGTRAVLLRALLARPADRFASVDEFVRALEGSQFSLRPFWIASASMVMVVAAVTMGVLEWETQRSAVCPSATSLLSGIWDEPTEATIAKAFDDTHLPFANDAKVGVNGVLGRYAASWVSAHDQSCTAALHARTRSGTGEKLSCLDDRKLALRKLTSELIHADGVTVTNAVSASYGLLSVDSCNAVASAESELVTAGEGPAKDPREADVRDQLARARALRSTGKSAAAIPLAEGAVALAKLAGDRSGEAHGEALLADLLDGTGDHARALLVSGQAVYAAEPTHNQALLENTWTGLARADLATRHFADAKVAAKHARSLHEGDVGHEANLRDAALLLVESEIFAQDHEDTEAERAAERAASLVEAETSPSDPNRLPPLEALGNASLRLGEMEKAKQSFTLALGVAEGAFGLVHPAVASCLDRVGALFDATADPAAIAIYRRALDIRSAAFGADSEEAANTARRLASSLASHGRGDEALTLLRQAKSTHVKLFGASNAAVLEDDARIAAVLVSQDQWELAKAEAGQTINHVEQAFGPESAMLISPLTTLGEALLGEGHAKGATEPLARAVAISVTRNQKGANVAEAEETLARALKETHGDAARIKELEVSARLVPGASH